MNVFTGASGNSNPKTPYSTNLFFGQTITLRAASEPDGSMPVEAVIRTETFLGYIRDYKDRKSESRATPPIFDLTVFGSRSVLKTNEVLLLGSPSCASVRTMIDRVPKLSDVPVIGRYFIKVQSETNYFRNLAIISRKLN